MDKTGSFKGWAEDAKSDINKVIKEDVEAALNLTHFKDFKVSLLSRPLRDSYQKQQEVLGLLPPAPRLNQLLTTFQVRTVYFSEFVIQ